MSSFKDTWYHDWDSNPHSAEQKHRSLKSLLLTARPQHLQSTQRLHFRYTLNTSGSELDPDPGHDEVGLGQYDLESGHVSSANIIIAMGILGL